MAAKNISLLFVTILFVVCYMASAPVTEAQVSGLLGLIRIGGTVFCTTNSTTATATTPVFPNALVQLKCGDTIVSSATTNSSGVFSILLDPITALLSSLLNNCKLVVNTPLSTCDASLPSTGVLESVLSLVGTVVQGLLRILNLAPTSFVLAQ